MTTTEALADFITSLRYEDLPPEVVARAKHLAVHSWGIQLASSTLPWSKVVYKYARRQGGDDEATIVNYGDRVGAANAAFANSAFAHGFELDDNHSRSSIKGGCVIIPTALAVGEREVSSGRDLITAIAVGYEILIRAALAIHPGEAARGTHWTGTNGAIGAAAVASKLMGAPRDHVTHALGCAAASRSGFSEVPATGRGHVKRIFGAMSAASGIRAADLAVLGMTGPTTTLDVGTGMCRAYDVDEELHRRYLDGLGDNWEILNVHFKIYAQDGYIQPMSQALSELRAEHDFTIEDIERVWIGTNHHAKNNIIGQIRDPKDLTDAQFSASYSVALFLTRGGAGFEHYTEDILHDEQIRGLNDRVVIDVDDEIDAQYRASRPRGAKVEVHLASGEVLRKTVHDLRAMTPAELDDKFRSLASVVLSDSRRDALLAAGNRLEEVRDVRALAPSLVHE